LKLFIFYFYWISLIISELALSVSTFNKITCPKSKVISQKLHYSSWISVLFLFKCVQILNGCVESLLGQFAGKFWRAHDFIIENRVVQGKTQSNWMSSLEFLGFFLCLFIRILCAIDNWFSFITLLEFTKISIIISFHLVEEHDGLWVGRVIEEFRLK
jgi:hypothetical protein